MSRPRSESRNPRPAGLKICGLTRVEDLHTCMRTGVDAVGINLWPGSKRYCAVEDARAMFAAADLDESGSKSGSGVRGRPARVGVFVDAPLAEVEIAVRALDLALIQPHGDAPVAPYAALAGRLGVGWVWVVRGTPDLATLELPSPAPAWVLLDAAVPGFGGAGRRTDWTWAARAVRALAPAQVWLAGGIHPDNAAEALGQVLPAGLDVASGAEIPGAARGEKQASAIASLVETCHAHRA